MITKVLACETQPVTAEGLRAVFSVTGDLELSGITESLRRSVFMARDLSPCVLLLDKAFGAQDVLSTLAEVRAVTRDTTAVVWGGGMSEAEAVRFLRAGAKGVISKSAPLDSIIDCVRSVSAGYTWTERRIPDPGSKRRNHRTQLTQREQQVLELVGQGMRNREVARELGIQPGTVKVHLKHIFEKTGVPDRYALALTGLSRV